MSEDSKSWQVIHGISWVAKWLLYTFLILGGLFFILGFAVAIFGVAPFEFAFSMFAGWAYHAFRVIPPLFAKWPSLILPIGCTLLFIAISHNFITWCLKKKESKVGWSLKHSFIGAAILLLTCSAAIAMSGIAHQLAWLSTSKIIESNRRSPVAKQVQLAKQLGYAAFNYENDHGHYPYSIHELHQKGYYDIPELMFIENGQVELGEPFILLAPGAKYDDVEEDHMLMASPHIHQRGNDRYHIVVLRVDMSVVDMDYGKYLKRLELQMKEAP